MKIPKLTARQIIGITFGLASAICVVFIAISVWRHGTNHQTPTQVETKPKNQLDKPAVTSQQNTVTSPVEPTIKSSSPACKQFSLTTAKAILGASTTLVAQDSTIISETSDMSISSCVYQTSDTDIIRLGAYLAKTQLGESTNALSFGSEKPPGVQDVPGYGQAAYWDAHSNILSVLKNNNRYDISHGANAAAATLDNALQAANNIVPKL